MHNKEDRKFEKANRKAESPYREEILKVRRVSTKRAGGSKFHYSVLCAVGDENGKVGIALAKSAENIKAIAKAKSKAKRNVVSINLTKDGSIPHELIVKRGASKILLRPAPLGTGVIAGGSVRTILELAGIKNISAKVIGTSNQIINAYALVVGLQSLRKVKQKDK